jgi:hypothetical protein
MARVDRFREFLAEPFTEDYLQKGFVFLFLSLNQTASFFV